MTELPARRIGSLRELLALVLLQALLLPGFENSIDLHFGDETCYQLQGRQLLAGTVEPTTLGLSPVYSAAYAGLQLLSLPGTAIQDLMNVLVGVSSTLVLWWCLLPMVPRVIAWFTAAWWGTTPWVIGFAVKGYVASGWLAAFALGLAARGRTGASLAVLALAAFNRLELSVWLLGAAAVIVWCGVRRGDRRLARTGVVGAVAGASLLAVLFALPEGRAHSWRVFHEFYARAVRSLPESDPVLSARSDAEIVASAFPGAQSVLSAAAADPVEFGRHLGRGLGMLPAAFWHLVAHPFQHAPWVRLTMLSVAAALLVLGLVGRRRWRSAENTLPERAELVPKILVVTSACLLPSVALFNPASYILLTFSPAVFVAAAWLMARGWRCLEGRLPPVAATDLLVVLMLAAAAVVPAPFVGVYGARPTREAVQLLRRAELGPNTTLAATHAWLLLGLADCPAQPRELELSGSVPEDLASEWLLLNAWDPGTPWLTRLAELSTAGWEPVESGRAAVLLRRSGR